MRFFCVVFVFVLVSFAHAEPTQVRVGGYVFPPFVQLSTTGEWSGLTLDVLDAFNRMQSEFHFEFVPTAATRRYRDFASENYDLMLFENPSWGWEGYAVDSFEGPVLGRDVFIARARQGRGQEYFNDLQSKRIALFSGYHYAFANFNSDKSYLRDSHNAVITFSTASNIQMVLRGRVELAIVTEAYLEDYLARHPEYRGKLIVAEEADQHYRHFLILRKGAEPGLDFLRALADQISASGELDRLLQQHYLRVLPGCCAASQQEDGIE